MKEAVIVAMGRSPIGKAPKGSLKYTRPEEIGAQVVRGILNKLPGFDPGELDDFIVGCAFPEAEQGLNMAKLVGLKAGFPENVPGQTLNRFCSSGLQAIAAAANCIMAGQADCIMAGGIEAMSTVPMGGNVFHPDPELMEKSPQAYMSMGITAENVADRYGIGRKEQDEFAAESHRRAAAAIKAGKFDEEIIPIEAERPMADEPGRPGIEKFMFSMDEGVRPDVTVEALNKLKPVFRMGGSVTAGNSSQTSDGAAFILMMRREKADMLGIKPLAVFKSFAVTGVEPEVMGIGPVEAIPKALELAGLGLKDMDLVELNEAFAAQAIACINELGLNREIVNVNGGAIALGHPLGCTGAYLTIKLLSEMKRREAGKYGLVSMCIGGGMGAAAVYEIVREH